MADTAINVLKKFAKIEGVKIILTCDKLPDKTFREIKKMFTSFGGKWKQGAFHFEIDPTRVLTEIYSGNSNFRKKHQFFYTPAQIVKEKILTIEALEDLQNWNPKILEPSAGQGHIIDVLVELGLDPELIDYCETAEENLQILKDKGYNNLVCENLLDIDVDLYGTYDLIIANPPFGKDMWIDHLYKMYDLVREGGIVVCITPDWEKDVKPYMDTTSSYKLGLGNNRKQEFYEWFNENHGWVHEKINKRDFAENGANVDTLVLAIQKLYS